MKKIYLHIILLYLGIFTSNAQVKIQAARIDTINYQSRKLKLDEVNIVSSYYNQDGNNSAVTGGRGTEKLSDIANTFDVQISKYGKSKIKHTFLFEIGVDHYTSASSDNIDPSTISSASSADTRVYPSLNWTRLDEKTDNSYGFTGSFSTEYDYNSIGAGFNLTRVSKNKNTQFDFKLQSFLDTWTVILPIELRTGPAKENDNYSTSPRNSFSTSFSLSQVLTTKLQALLIIEPSFQKGLLATKYQRNYFTDGSLRAENLPNKRYKLPIAIRLNYFLNDKFVIRSFYRYYTDNWGIRANTAEIEIPIKLTSFFSISPFYRYSEQTGVKYFAAYGQHNIGETFFTSDYDLSALNSNFYGFGIHFSPPKGVFGWQRLNMLELRYGHYTRSASLTSNVVSLNFKFK